MPMISLIFLKDEYQVASILETISLFSSVSGLKLTFDKTEAMWLGSYRDRKDTPFGFKWPSVIRFLGIYLGYNSQETFKFNWLNKLEKFQNPRLLED